MPHFDGKYYADCKTIKDMLRPMTQEEYDATPGWWYGFIYVTIQPRIPYRILRAYYILKGRIKNALIR